MYKRPTSKDSEDDILQMQKTFLEQKSKNKIQPAAQVVKTEKAKKLSLFARSRQNKEEWQPEKEPVTAEKYILGDIVERKAKGPPKIEEDCTRCDDCSSRGFPKVERVYLKSDNSTKSLFALSVERKRLNQNESNPHGSDEKVSKTEFTGSSVILSNSATATSIHQENVKFLENMTKEEILEERAKLLQSLDPKLVKFLEEKRKRGSHTGISAPTLSTVNEASSPHIIEERMSKPPVLEDCSSMDVDKVDDEADIFETTDAVAEILKNECSNKWIHFDAIEKDKLQWMRNLPAKMKTLKPGEKFEARFDFKGVLLPHSEELTDKNRELYLHGDEPERPGYTIQELFRLARSNVMQQRILAFKAIHGILNIYSQGFYDGILDVPVTKIFFLLRFGLDENNPAILRIISRALATMFCNDTDEFILDVLYETSEGCLQPNLEVEGSVIETENVSDQSELEKDLTSLKLTSSPFTMNIPDDEETVDIADMNDFQLAEQDLISCLLRTNILQRINYIINTIRPNDDTVLSCIQILIRIARTNKDACMNIITSDVIQTLMDNFLPKYQDIATVKDDEFYGMPQHLVLKLIRILVSQHISFAIKFTNENIIELIKGYIFIKDDIQARLIKVQIESLRLLRALILIKRDAALYREFLPAFRFMLEWHYQYFVYEVGGPFLIRQHASSLIAVISCGDINDIKPVLGDLLSHCCCKWLHQATNHGIKEFSQLVLLSTCLNCISNFIVDPNINQEMKLFLNKYLGKFIESHSYLEFQNNVCQSSILIKRLSDRRNIHSPLPNLGSILGDSGSPRILIPEKYPIILLRSVFKVLNRLCYCKHEELGTSFVQHLLTDELKRYFEKLALGVNRKIATNFLAKTEIKLVYEIFCRSNVDYSNILPRETILRIVYNLLSCMTVEHVHEIEQLFSSIIFTEQYLHFSQEILDKWKAIYLEHFVYPHQIVIPATDASLSMPYSQHTILPLDWPYLLLKTLLNRYLQQMKEDVKEDMEFPGKDIIKTTLSFVDVLERNGLEVTSPTEKLLYLMLAFMGPESEFLEPDMKEFLKNHVDDFFHRNKDHEFQLEKAFKDKCKFENLYILFVNHFQAASYGDTVFSSLVLVPLAQKYDAKWRKMIWSEHVSILRFLDCDELQLCGSMDNYLYPYEEDSSLIKSYMQALNSNLLRPGTIPYKVASHHVNHFMDCKKDKPVKL